MDVLLIPCFRRGEFLWHTLDNLVKTGDLDTVKVIFKPDAQHTQEIIHVIKEWAPHLPSWEVASAIPSKHRATKQSLNVLSGYKYAATKTDGLVFQVEEDVMVARDFLKFHRALHANEPNLFCSLSTKNHNRSPTLDGLASSYYLSHGDFCSLGVVMRKEVIEQHINPHINDQYLAHSQAYCKTNWPASTIGDGFTEQDGLIRRIQEAGNMPTAYPHVPRAFHAGFYGYNRHKYVTGSLQQRIDMLARTIYNPEAMRRAALSPAYVHDSVPVPLDIEPWETLEHVPA